MASSGGDETKRRRAPSEAKPRGGGSKAGQESERAPTLPREAGRAAEREAARAAKQARDAERSAERMARKRAIADKKRVEAATKLADRTRRDAERARKAAAERARKTRLPALERRAQLVEVGRAVFADLGYEGTSVEEIAARAKVSKPIVYEHFGGKEGLYAVIVDREMDYVVRRIAEAIGEGTPRERVERASLAFLAYVRDDPDGFAVLSQDSPLTAGSGRMTSLLNDLAERVGHVFLRSLEDAGYDVKAAPIYAHALVGMVTFVGRWWTGVRKPPIEEVARHMSALAWMGLRHLPKKPELRTRPR